MSLTTSLILTGEVSGNIAGITLPHWLLAVDIRTAFAQCHYYVTVWAERDRGMFPAELPPQSKVNMDFCPGIPGLYPTGLLKLPRKKISQFS